MPIEPEDDEVDPSTLSQMAQGFIINANLRAVTSILASFNRRLFANCETADFNALTARQVATLTRIIVRTSSNPDVTTEDVHRFFVEGIDKGVHFITLPEGSTIDPKLEAVPFDDLPSLARLKFEMVKVVVHAILSPEFTEFTPEFLEAIENDEMFGLTETNVDEDIQRHYTLEPTFKDVTDDDDTIPTPTSATKH